MPSEYCLPIGGIIPGPDGKRPPAAAIAKIIRPGFIARSIADLEILYGTCAAPSPEEPLMRFLTPPGERPSARPKVAFCRTLGKVPVEGQYARAFDDRIRALSEKGFAVRELQPDFIDTRSLKECFNRLVFGAQAADMPLPVRLAMKLAMRDANLFSLDMKRYLEAEEERAAQIKKFDKALGDDDLLLLPVSSTSAFTHRKTGTKNRRR